MATANNTTRHKTHCDGCGRVIFWSHAKPKTLCTACQKKDEAEIVGTTCFHCGNPALPETHYRDPRCERHRDV